MVLAFGHSGHEFGINRRGGELRSCVHKNVACGDRSDDPLTGPHYSTLDLRYEEIAQNDAEVAGRLKIEILLLSVCE